MLTVRDELDTASVAQLFIDAWSYISAQYPEHIVARIGPVAVTLSQTSCPFFNVITVNAPMADAGALGRTIATARGYAERSPHGVMLSLAPDWMPDNAADVLADEGLTLGMSLWGMTADRLAPMRRAEPRLEYRFASDAATAVDLGRVNADAYDVPPELLLATGNLPDWMGTQFSVVGYENGQAVTSAQAFLLGDTIYIALVATLRERHGKGYGEAVMRRAIEAAQEAVGEKRLYLHATESGRPLYRSMGFVDGARLDLYNFENHA